jgi:hypothetical protein
MVFDAHARAFSFGGVPRRGIYDNLKPAVECGLHRSRVASGASTAAATSLTIPGRNDPTDTSALTARASLLQKLVRRNRQVKKAHAGGVKD